MKPGDRVWFYSPNEFWRDYNARKQLQPATVGGIVERISDPDHQGNQWVDVRFDDHMFHCADRQVWKVIT